MGMCGRDEVYGERFGRRSRASPGRRWIKKRQDETNGGRNNAPRKTNNESETDSQSQIKAG